MKTTQGEIAIRAWAASACWTGRKPFWFGTVYTRADAPEHEARAEAEAKLRAGLEGILPVNVPLPDRFEIIPGKVWFIPEEN